MKRIRHKLLLVGMMTALLIPCSLFAAKTVTDEAGFQYTVENKTSFYVEFTESRQEGLKYFNDSAIYFRIIDPENNEIHSCYLPGTWDDGIDDSSPSIGINPSDGNIYVIWSRKDGIDFDLYMAGFDGERWTYPRFLTTWSGNDLDPTFIFDSAGRIHILWWQNNPEERIFYNNFKPHNPEEVDTFEYDSKEILTSLEGFSGLYEPQTPSSERFPILSYNELTDTIIFAITDPADGSIIFFSFRGIHEADGGGDTINPARILLPRGEEGDDTSVPDSSHINAITAAVLFFKDSSILIWVEESRVCYVILYPEQSSDYEVFHLSRYASSSLEESIDRAYRAAVRTIMLKGSRVPLPTRK